MSSYDEQLIKWAAKKYKVPANQIGRVRLNLATFTEGYCHTCEYTDVQIEVDIFSKKDKLIKSTTESRYDFSTILAEIIQA